MAEATDKDDGSLNAADLITKDDWGVLQTVHDILSLFWKLTLRLQGQAANGHHGAIWEVVPAIEVLMKHLEAALQIHTARKAKYLNVCINNALAKLQKYYQLISASPIYIASLVLNPAVKERYFDRNWGSGDKALKAKDEIREFWNAEYKNKAAIRPDSTLQIPALIEERDFDEFEAYLYDSLRSPALDLHDEYEFYCQEKPLPKVPPNLIRYWSGQQINTPSLAQMPFDLLPIPAMAAECERVFSGTKILISDHRCRLKDRSK